MPKLNPSTKKASVDTTVRLAGGAGSFAAKQDNIAILRRMVMANLLWEDIAYVDGKSVVDEIQKIIPECDPAEVAKLAVEARVEQKLRHIPLLIAVNMAKYKNMRSYVREILPKIITRADMLTDFMALYWKNGKIPVANCIKKGLAEAFHNFKEYHFAKYDRDTAIKLRDVMFICHPKPRDKDEEELYKRIANRTLKTPDTWEVAISATKDKTAEWTRLIEEKKLGGLAFLRNMANFMKNSVSHKIIAEGIKNLKSSMLLPLDFLKAAEMTPEFKSQLSAAMVEGYKNLPKLPGKTLFILDCSGSMHARISSKSLFTRQQVANAMAMLAANQCEDYELVCTAGNDITRKHASMQIKYPALGFDLFDQIKKCSATIDGGGIFTRQVLEWCKKNVGDKFDRIIVFSDSQDCDYPDKRIPAPFGKYNYICDVSCEKHGVNFNGKWTAEISGWSEHFLTYIAAHEGLQNNFEEE